MAALADLAIHLKATVKHSFLSWVRSRIFRFRSLALTEPNIAVVPELFY
jgi:hypothetical protein